MEYSEFSITIRETDQDGRHIIRVACPEGDYAGRFTNPFSKDKLKEKLVDNKLSAKSSEDIKVRGGLTDIKPVASVDDLKEIGNLLYRSLFREGVMEAFAACVGRMEADKGIRIRIRIDPKLEQYAELMSLPWEFLYDDSKREFIALKDNMVIVRYPEAPSRIAPLEVTPPLRVLALASEPSDYDALRLGKEIRSLVSVLRSENVPIEIKLLDQATIEALDDETHRQKYHIFHFMGHGDYDLNSGRSTLVFEHGDGTGHRVDGETLRLALTDSIKLVFLNACETARVGDVDPFAAISTELALSGVPAVLAMQFPISDAAAVAFSRRFYTLLATGLPVDQCLDFGRRAIRYNHEIAAEWGTPVLFMRSSDGIIFRISQDSGQQAKLETERRAREEAARREAEQQLKEEADRKADEEAARREAEQRIKADIERRAREEAAEVEVKKRSKTKDEKLKETSARNRVWWLRFSIVGAIALLVSSLFGGGMVAVQTLQMIIIPICTLWLAYFRPLRWGYVALLVAALHIVAWIAAVIYSNIQYYGYFFGIYEFLLILAGNVVVAAVIARWRQRRMQASD